MPHQYFGQETENALENFPFPLPPVHKELLHCIAIVKKATARANEKTKRIPHTISMAIQQACDEIISGTFDDQLVTCSLQGGAGTSMHMNINEIIAHRAEELLKNGKTILVHANDHVNLSQSTNDINPSALKLCSLLLTKKLITGMQHLEKSLMKRAKEHKHTIKLGRTHFQDAVPTTIGAEFLSYAAILGRDRERIESRLTNFYELNLGGTAIGNSINAPKQYQKFVYEALREITGFPFRPADNMMSQTSSPSDFVDLSSSITIFCMDLSKIASDIRFLSSGPNGGIGEITLPPLQKGSSIMPGKVNPVIPESINQTYYCIAGKNLTIHEAAQNGCLELGIMFPILADSLITEIQVTNTAVRLFADKCIQILQVNKDRCRELLEKSTAYATLLTPILGYDVVAKLVNESQKEKRSFLKLVMEKQLVSSSQLQQIFSL